MRINLLAFNKNRKYREIVEDNYEISPQRIALLPIIAN